MKLHQIAQLRTNIFVNKKKSEIKILETASTGLHIMPIIYFALHLQIT